MISPPAAQPPTPVRIEGYPFDRQTYARMSLAALQVRCLGTIGGVIGLVLGLILMPMLVGSLTHNAVLTLLALPVGAIIGLVIGMVIALKALAR